MYALAELGSLEYSGLITGKVNYESCFNYYLKAAKKNHPKASWMVANLIYYKKISGYTTEFAYEYINKAIKLGSIAAINTLGNFYYNGFTLDNKKTLIKPQSATLKQQNQVMYMPITILVDTTKTSMKKKP